MKRDANPLGLPALEEPIPDRVHRWTAAEVELMRGTIELLEQTLERARAELRAAERRIAAGSS